MMLARDVRRRWMQYGENRRDALDNSYLFENNEDLYICDRCKNDNKNIQIDHIKPLGPRPRIPRDFFVYIWNMFNRPCQALCKKCHKKKTDAERKRRKENK